MARVLFSCVAAALLALAGLRGVEAQTGPISPSVTPVPAAEPSGGLSESDLLASLQQLDPNVKISNLSGGGMEYRLTCVVDGWTYALRVESFQSSIWLDVELGDPIVDLQRVPASDLAELMHTHLKIGPTHFTFVKVNACRMVSRAVPREAFGAEIARVCKDVRDTYAQWSKVIAAAR